MRDDTASVRQILSLQLDQLAARVRAVQTPGNIDGLFGFHVLELAASSPATPEVNCATTAWLEEHRDRVFDYPVVAALGYSLFHFGRQAPEAAWDTFARGIGRLRQRDPFPADRIAFPYQPMSFLGIALGAKASEPRARTDGAWLAGLIDDKRLDAAGALQRLMYSYVRFVLTGKTFVASVAESQTAPELGMIEWGCRRGAFRLDNHDAEVELRRRVLEQGLTAVPRALEPGLAALLWGSMTSVVSRSIDEAFLSKNHVGALLRRFEAAMRRWRWDDPASTSLPIRWPISSEREVQDILWILLRGVFEDLVDEETLAKFGHSSYRADFGIPTLRILIEVKFVRTAKDFRSIEREIAQDAAAYLISTNGRYDELVVFIYDDSSSVQEHAITESALRQLPQVLDVVIASKPSQLTHP